MLTPKISVIMGVLWRKDGLAPLGRSVSSILAQSESDFEFLICDDGSNEAAVQFLNQLSQEDNRIRLLRIGSKFSLSEKLNCCLEHARGVYIARMDDDDYSHPDRFAKQIAYLETHSDVAFTGCNVNLKAADAHAGHRILPENPTIQDFYMVQPYVHPTLIFRKEALINVGGYSEDKRAFLCEDYDLLLRMYAAGYHGHNQQEVLFDYTIPITAKGTRRMAHRWNETVIRYRRFRQLNLLPIAWPYVVKPLVVGLLPEKLLRKLKKNYVYT